MDREEKISRGQRAQALLADEMLVAAFQSVADGYALKWKNALSVQEREDCHRAVKIVDAVKKHLMVAASIGTQATQELEFEEKNRSLTRLFRRA